METVPLKPKRRRIHQLGDQYDLVVLIIEIMDLLPSSYETPSSLRLTISSMLQSCEVCYSIL